MTEEAEHEKAEKVRSGTSASLISNLPEMTLYDTQAEIPITRTNIPLPPADIVIARPAQHSRLTSAIHELGHLLCQNAVSSRPTSPSLEGAFVSAQPGPSSELVRSIQPDLTVTSLSTIGMSL